MQNLSALLAALAVAAAVLAATIGIKRLCRRMLKHHAHNEEGGRNHV